MFKSALTRLKKKLSEATLIADWHEQLREIIYQSSPSQSSIILDNSALEILRVAAPEKLTWRLFDHYASIGQIYAVFELAIIDLVEEYVRILPRVTPSYANLDESVRTSHRVGVGHVLMKWSATQPIYSKIPESSIAAGFADGLREQKYVLLSQAFLTDSDNYRPDTLNRVFKKIGFNDAFSVIKKDSGIEQFCKLRLTNHTAESYLNKFVLERNEAAHGDISEIATSEQIKNYAEFIELVVVAFARMLESSIIKSGISSGATIQVGTVAHVYSEGVCGVRAYACNFEISIGQHLYIGKKSLIPAITKSLRQEKTAVDKLLLTDELEFGLKLDRSAKIGDAIYVTML